MSPGSCHNRPPPIPSHLPRGPLFGGCLQKDPHWRLPQGVRHLPSSESGRPGSRSLGTSAQGKVGFRPNGRIVSDMMAEKTITLFAPPFSATLQLKNSRTAICKVVMQCGATVPGCTRSSQKSVRAVKCSSGYKRRKGKCVLIQNCGANAYRGPEGDCYCKKNYEMRSGKCVWKTNKKGFEVAPWNKPGCKTWERQCNQRNSNACLKYEQTCQPN